MVTMNRAQFARMGQVRTCLVAPFVLRTPRYAIPSSKPVTNYWNKCTQRQDLRQQRRVNDRTSLILSPLAW